MDVESSASKQSARDRLGLDRPTGAKLGVVSTKLAQKTPIRTTVSTKVIPKLFYLFV